MPAIDDFGDAWRGSIRFNVTSVGNYEFGAKILYRSNARGFEQQDCGVRIIRNGFQDGFVIIKPRGLLKTRTHHLNFDPAFQEYEYDEEDADLIVTGDSPKMGGDYTVIISPNGKAYY